MMQNDKITEQQGVTPPDNGVSTDQLRAALYDLELRCGTRGAASLWLGNTCLSILPKVSEDAVILQLCAEAIALCPAKTPCRVRDKVIDHILRERGK